MGILIQKPPHASETRDWVLRQYEYLHDPRGPESEWFIGDEERFKFKYRWITKDNIWWKEGYVEHPRELARIEIRKWIERHLDGDVMVEEGKDSAQYEDADKSWQTHFHNKYWIDFHFETNEDLSHFLIRWA